MHLLTTLQPLWKKLCQGGALMVGIPDYATYVRHMQHTHPAHPIMTQPQFIEYCMNARYAGKKQGKCPC